MLETSKGEVKNLSSQGIEPSKIFQMKVRELGQNTGIKFVKPEDRKNFLAELANKLTKSYSKFRHEMPEEAQFHIGSVLIYLIK